MRAGGFHTTARYRTALQEDERRCAASKKMECDARMRERTGMMVSITATPAIRQRTGLAADSGTAKRERQTTPIAVHLKPIHSSSLSALHPLRPPAKLNWRSKAAHNPPRPLQDLARLVQTLRDIPQSPLPRRTASSTVALQGSSVNEAVPQVVFLQSDSLALRRNVRLGIQSSMSSVSGVLPSRTIIVTRSRTCRELSLRQRCLHLALGLRRFRMNSNQ